jgi:hypothetical protein
VVSSSPVTQRRVALRAVAVNVLSSDLVALRVVALHAVALSVVALRLVTLPRCSAVGCGPGLGRVVDCGAIDLCAVCRGAVRCVPVGCNAASDGVVGCGAAGDCIERKPLAQRFPEPIHVDPAMNSTLKGRSELDWRRECWWSLSAAATKGRQRRLTSEAIRYSEQVIRINISLDNHTKGLDNDMEGVAGSLSAFFHWRDFPSRMGYSPSLSFSFIGSVRRELSSK